MISEREIWYLTFNVLKWIAEFVIFIIIFSHVWTRKGYEGIDGILELREVDKFITHIISAGSFLTLDSLSIWEPIMGYSLSWEWKAVFAGGFLGSGIYLMFGSTIKSRLLRKDSNEPIEQK
jgi:hypothetical protein